MFDWDKVHIEIMHYIGENFDVDMPTAALDAEQLTEIVKKIVEEEFINGSE